MDVFKPINDNNELFTNTYYSKIKLYLYNYIEYIQHNDNINLPLNRLNYYALKQKKTRFTSYGSIIMRSKVEVRFPFYDNDIIDFILTIPPSLRLNKYIYLKSIIKLFPHLSNIPWQKTQAPLTTNKLHLKAKNKFRRTKRRLNRLIGRIDNEYPRDYADYPNWMRTDNKLKEYIINILLDERTLARSYFNQEYVKKIIDLHMNGETDYSELIGRLLTFELWNRQFIDK